MVCPSRPARPKAVQVPTLVTVTLAWPARSPVVRRRRGPGHTEVVSTVPKLTVHQVVEVQRHIAGVLNLEQ
jgi:hypothetical protein